MAVALAAWVLSSGDSPHTTLNWLCRTATIKETMCFSPSSRTRRRHLACSAFADGDVTPSKPYTKHFMACGLAVRNGQGPPAVSAPLGQTPPDRALRVSWAGFATTATTTTTTTTATTATTTTTTTTTAAAAATTTNTATAPATTTAATSANAATPPPAAAATDGSFPTDAMHANAS